MLAVNASVRRAEAVADGTIVRPFLPRTAFPRAAPGFAISLTGSEGATARAGSESEPCRRTTNRITGTASETTATIATRSP